MPEKKVHRRCGRGKPLCGKNSTNMTPDNDKVTCGLCIKSMWRSWGIEPPPGTSRNLGGRKKKKQG